MSDTFERIRKVVAEAAEVDQDSIQCDTSIKTGLPIDSLTQVEILMNLETEFGIAIDEGEASQLDTVQQYIDYINAALTGNKQTLDYI